jgi:MoxR-like ATPase
VSPRGTLDLMRFSQASAFVNGRDYVLPDDIKQSAPAVLGHRIIVKKGTRLATSGNINIIDELVDTVKVPV